MPTYQFRSNKTGEEWTKSMSWKELDQYYIDNDCQQVIGVPQTISSHGEDRLKTSDAFNDRLKEMHKHAGRHSTMSDSIK